MRVVLVTGAGGFTGSHLTKLLEASKQDQAIRRVSRAPGENAYVGDLADRSFVKNILEDCHPTQIYHLAGSFTNDFEVDFRNNVTTTRNLIEEVQRLDLHVRILLVGSAAEYGTGSVRSPIKEDQKLDPTSVYGMTKAWQTLLMRLAVSGRGLDLVMARPFNFIGRGASRRLFIGALYDQIDRYHRQEIARIDLDDLDVRRDYLPIEKAVSDYQLIMENGSTGEVYHVASGRPTSLRSIALEALEEAGISENAIRISGKHSVSSGNVEEIYASTEKIDLLRFSLDTRGRES